MVTGKGKKRLRNIPVFYDSPKKSRTIWLTDDAWQMIERLASTFEATSKSEYLEELIRKRYFEANANVDCD
ncbi:MAG: hypothetical protein V7K67_21080 [Nostoc sp.]|uniref:hypothetical protein n=1 Tax=Nostoc sp. TaxID=1180 RepID=UPI002FF551A6